MLLFDVDYADRSVEYQVFGYESVGAARVDVDFFAAAVGRLPAVLRSRLKEVEIRPTGPGYGGNELGYIHITSNERDDRNQRFEEVLMHEGAHASVDAVTEEEPGWLAAQEADDAFISDYARNSRGLEEDVAETFNAWFALRYRPEVLSEEMRIAIERTIPARLAYLDEQDFDVSPFERP